MNFEKNDQTMLEHFDLTTAELIGQGGEAQVYALDSERVVRLYRGLVSPETVERRRRFYEQIRCQKPLFAVPHIMATGTHAERTYTIEARMPGSDFSKVLVTLTGRERERALLSYLHVAQQIGTIRLLSEPFGELLVQEKPIQRNRWTPFLWDKMQSNLARSRADLCDDVAHFDERLAVIQQMIGLVDNVEAKCLVHGDYFPGNVFIDDNLAICGVGDFGVTTVVGDPQMDLAGAIAFLEVVESYRPDDTAFLLERAVAQHGPAIRQIIELYSLYYAIYFSHCKLDDPTTYWWCVAKLRAF